MSEQSDDGSLSFLGIGRDPQSRSFNCETTRQMKLVNTTFWVVDYMEDIPTKFSRDKGKQGQTLVMIKSDPSLPDSEALKFFTGSSDILYVLREIRKRDAFPRRVTLRQSGNRFYLE